MIGHWNAYENIFSDYFQNQGVECEGVTVNFPSLRISVDRFRVTHAFFIGPFQWDGLNSGPWDQGPRDRGPETH